MNPRSPIDEYIEALNASPRLSSQVVIQTILPARRAVWQPGKRGWSEFMKRILRAAGIREIYEHQATAIERPTSNFKWEKMNRQTCDLEESVLEYSKPLPQHINTFFQGRY